MQRKRKDIPFWYERSKFRFLGTTEKDRNLMKLDNILYWVYRIIIATSILISVNNTNAKFFISMSTPSLCQGLGGHHFKEYFTRISPILVQAYRQEAWRKSVEQVL